MQDPPKQDSPVETPLRHDSPPSEQNKSTKNPLSSPSGHIVFQSSHQPDPLSSSHEPRPPTVPYNKSLNSDPLQSNIDFNDDSTPDPGQFHDTSTTSSNRTYSQPQNHSSSAPPSLAPPPSLPHQPSSSVTPIPRLSITVSDPVKRVSDHAFIPGLTSSHYEYLITSIASKATAQYYDDNQHHTNDIQTSSHVDSNNNETSGWPKSEVRRRFNDFVV